MSRSGKIDLPSEMSRCRGVTVSCIRCSLSCERSHLTSPRPTITPDNRPYESDVNLAITLHNRGYESDVDSMISSDNSVYSHARVVEFEGHMSLLRPVHC
jgi:hypothetical protein